MGDGGGRRGRWGEDRRPRAPAATGDGGGGVWNDLRVASRSRRSTRWSYLHGRVGHRRKGEGDACQSKSASSSEGKPGHSLVKAAAAAETTAGPYECTSAGRLDAGRAAPAEGPRTLGSSTPARCASRAPSTPPTSRPAPLTQLPARQPRLERRLSLLSEQPARSSLQTGSVSASVRLASALRRRPPPAPPTPRRTHPRPGHILALGSRPVRFGSAREGAVCRRECRHQRLPRGEASAPPGVDVSLGSSPPVAEGSRSAAVASTEQQTGQGRLDLALNCSPSSVADAVDHAPPHSRLSPWA